MQLLQEIPKKSQIPRSQGKEAPRVVSGGRLPRPALVRLQHRQGGGGAAAE